MPATSIAQTIAALKRAPAGTTVAVEPATGLRLVPLSYEHVADDVLIEQLAAWRHRYADRYPTQFEVTVEGTRAWLRDRVLGAPARVLFLLVPRGEDRACGHLGFDRALGGDGTIECINLLRGDRERVPGGAMARCVDVAVGWAVRELGVATVWVTPFSDNAPAIRCLEAAGFVSGERIALRRHERDGRVEYRRRGPDDAAPADRSWLRMTNHLAR